MKIGILKSVGHNIADSVASGVGLMVGVYDMNIFFEASCSPEGFIEVDFLTGNTRGSPITPSLASALNLYRDALPALCEKQGIEFSSVAALSARFGEDAVYGPHFTVSVKDVQGRQSTEKFVGLPGRKFNRRR